MFKRCLQIYFFACLLIVSVHVQSENEVINSGYITTEEESVELAAYKSLVRSPKSFKSENVSYSDAEKLWIHDNPIIYFSDVSWLPYVSIGKEVSGIGKDYLDIVAKDSGLKFKFVPPDDWKDVLDKLKTHQISLTIAAGITKKRSEFAIFSEPYISSSMSIVTSEKYSYVQNLDQLDGLTIAIPEGLYLASFIKKEYPSINLVFTDTIVDALTLVAKNKADAFIGSMAVVASHLRSAELYNLRVSGVINKELDIHFMVDKTQPELVKIINKSLARIKEVERRGIANRWFAVNYNTGISSKTVWMIVLVAILIIGISLYWIKRLRFEIHQKNLIQRALKSARVDAELANKAKSEFLANMSHEIRTPMNAIVGFSNLLSESELTEKQKTYLRSIRVGSDGLLHIINDILDLSKIEAGKMQIEYIPTDLHKLIEDLGLLFHSGMKDKGIRFETKIDEDVPRYLLIDSNRIRQILLNVVGNAQKFTECGDVKLRVRCELSESAPDLIDLFVEISDTGIGIEKEALKSIFNHFEQNNQGSFNRYGGTGLGLAISRKLAEKMNGSLTATSVKGKGSCFTLSISQISLTKELTAANVDQISYKFEDSVILVVDDIESNRMLITKYLQDYPFEIYIAVNGAEAIEVAKKTNPNMILMDLRMPIMDGYEATQIIKNSMQTIVIALTASALEDEESKEKQKIFDDFLRKPILKSKLISTMARYLANEYQVKPQQKKQELFDFDSEITEKILKSVSENFREEVIKAHRFGDVKKLEEFADSLIEASNSNKNKALEIFANKLRTACQSFDVEQIDILVKLFANKL